MKTLYGLVCTLIVLGTVNAAENGTPFSKEQEALVSLKVNNINQITSIMEFADGAEWKAMDQKVIANWKPSDGYTFGVQQGWFGNEYLILTNVNTQDSVEIQLVKQASSFKENSHWIAFMDAKACTLFLENGAIFFLYPSDLSLFQGWSCDDFILVGEYHSYISDYSHVLYNFRTGQYCFAKLKK